MKKSDGHTCECGEMHHCHNTKRGGRSGGGAVYCLGVIGAAIYYISTATGFWVGVLGVLKAFVWPAFLVYWLTMRFDMV